MKTSPPRFSCRGPAAAAILFWVALAAAGCGDSTAPPPADGDAPPDTVRVAAVDRDTGAPRAGIKIVLMDQDNRLAATPGVTGADGQVTFVLPEPPALAFVVVFTGDQDLVNDLPPTLIWSGDDPPASVRSATVTIGARTQPGTLPRLAGRVVDADTQQPLVGVFVSLSPYLSGYLGRTDPSDDVTLADGLFRVSNIPFAPDPFSGTPVQVSPLIVTREGYLPTIYTHAMPPGADDLDITGLVIMLAPDRGGSGALTGIVMFGREPVVGLPMGLGSIGQDGGKVAVGQPGLVAVTDQEGRYTFTDLASGGYLMHAGYRLDDGWAMPSQPASRLYTVVGDETTTADTLQVIRSITPLEPLGPQATVPDRFAWHAVAEADSYTVYLGGVRLGRTAVPALEGVDLTSLAPGWRAWTVTATTAAGEVVGGSETLARFRMPQPDPLD